MSMSLLTLLVRDLDAARAFYAGPGSPVQEPSSDETQVALVVDDDIALDLLPRAVSAGGRQLRAPHEDGTASTGTFADPDGHVWEAVSLDLLHVIN